MVDRNGHDPKLAQFAEVVRRRQAEAGISHAALGEAMAEIEGREYAYSPQAISRWLTTSPPRPPQMRSMEEALTLKPGALSSLFGYVPDEAKGARSVLEAIDVDPKLDRTAKRLLGTLYKEAVK